MLSRLDAGGHPQAGALWFSDIASMQMPVELVVLSACQTANGDRLPGEGLVGLSYSFLIAGSRRVIGSLWDVDDAATAELMRHFYQALYQGRHPRRRHCAPPKGLLRKCRGGATLITGRVLPWRGIRIHCLD